MRLVLKIDNAIASNRECTQKLTNAVVRLLGDGHRVMIIVAEDPENPEKRTTEAAPVFSNGNLRGNRRTPLDLIPIGPESRFLAACLSHAGVPSMALSGTDAGICRLRRRYHDALRATFTVEISSVDSHWIELICANGGVPVISNSVMESFGEFNLADSDQMASNCAIDWNADALIYLTDSKGITNANGMVMRWLDAATIDCQQELGNGVPGSILRGCKQALQRGVRRTRILPAASLDSLPLFYFARIEGGTEVVLATSEQPLVDSLYSVKSTST